MGRKRGKKKKTMPVRHPHPIRSISSLGETEFTEVKRIFKTLNTVTMGCCHSGIAGVCGSVRPTSLIRVLSALGPKGGHLVGFGCGFGRVLLSAIAMGFHGATGWELAENVAQHVAFEATKAKLSQDYAAASWLGQDILNLDLSSQFCGQVTSAYAFWVGFPEPVQHRILDFCRSAFTNICSVAVFLDRKWPKPEKGMTIPRHSFVLVLD